MIVVFSLPSVLDGPCLGHESEVMQFELVAHRLHFSPEVDVVSFFQNIDHIFIVLVRVFRDLQKDVCEGVRL